MTKPTLTALMIVVVSAIYVRLLRPWHMNWPGVPESAIIGAHPR